MVEFFHGLSNQGRQISYVSGINVFRGIHPAGKVKREKRKQVGKPF